MEPRLSRAARRQINTTLQTLELNGNVIDYDGVSALAEALTENTSLTTLHIRCGLAGLAVSSVSCGPSSSVLVWDSSACNVLDRTAAQAFCGHPQARPRAQRTG